LTKAGVLTSLRRYSPNMSVQRFIATRNANHFLRRSPWRGVAARAVHQTQLRKKNRRKLAAIAALRRKKFISS
jgi:hypothetical protein